MNYDDPNWVPPPMQGMRGFSKDDPELLELDRVMKEPGPSHGGKFFLLDEIGNEVAAIFRRAFVREKSTS